MFRLVLKSWSRSKCRTIDDGKKKDTAVHPQKVGKCIIVNATAHETHDLEGRCLTQRNSDGKFQNEKKHQTPWPE